MISYAKLKSGSWGIRSTNQVTEGQTVTVTKKSGETKPETVQRVVWTDGSTVWLCAIGAAQTTASRSSGGRFTYCEGWGSDNPHSPISGHCAQCAEMGE